MEHFSLEKNADTLPIVMMVHDDRIDRRVLDEARSLVKGGCKVTVLAAPPPAPGDRRDEEAYPEIEIVRVDPAVPLAEDPPIPAGYESFAALNWKPLFYYAGHFYAEAAKRPAAIYVAHDLPQLPPAIMAAALHGGYVVYDAHELYPDQDYFIRNKQDQVLTAIETWLAPMADQAITVNKSIAEFMTMRYKIPLPEVILNCPAPHNVQGLPVPRTDVLRQELNIPVGKRILLYQGIYAMTRNLQNVIRAMKLVHREDVVFVLMGPGFEKENQLSTLSAELGLLNERVYVRPAVDQTELLRYSASADAGIIPYHYTELNNYYCTPNKLFEFIVAGLPILANDLPELNRFVGQQGIGRNMPMSTPEEIAAAIDAFFALDLEGLRRSAQGISPQFTWASQAVKLLGIYDRLLEHKQRSLGGPLADLPDSLLGLQPQPEPANNSQANGTPPPGLAGQLLPLPQRLNDISTTQLLGEIKRRIGIRLQGLFGETSFLYRLIHWLYKALVKPVYALIRKFFVRA